MIIITITKPGIVLIRMTRPRLRKFGRLTHGVRINGRTRLGRRRIRTINTNMSMNTLVILRINRIVWPGMKTIWMIRPGIRRMRIIRSGLGTIRIIRITRTN